MSFLVNYLGQFSAYKLPDLSANDHVRAVGKSSLVRHLKDHEEDDFEPYLQSKNRASSSAKTKAISSYEKIKTPLAKKKTTLARDIMSSPVVFLHASDSLAQAIKEMGKKNFRHLPVLNESNVLCGMLSEKDILGFKGQHHEPVANAMTKEVLTAFDRASVADIARIMLYERINSLPIINESHEVVGMVTNSDILNLVVQTGRLELLV